jgi:hypothetical protein
MINRLLIIKSPVSLLYRKDIFDLRIQSEEFSFDFTIEVIVNNDFLILNSEESEVNSQYLVFVLCQTDGIEHLMRSKNVKKTVKWIKPSKCISNLS